VSTGLEQYLLSDVSRRHKPSTSHRVHAEQRSPIAFMFDYKSYQVVDQTSVNNSVTGSTRQTESQTGQNLDGQSGRLIPEEAAEPLCKKSSTPIPTNVLDTMYVSRDEVELVFIGPSFVTIYHSRLKVLIVTDPWVMSSRPEFQATSLADCVNWVLGYPRRGILTCNAQIPKTILRHELHHLLQLRSFGRFGRVQLPETIQLGNLKELLREEEPSDKERLRAEE